MSEYLILNILIILGPLALSFEHRIRYIKKIAPVLTSVALAGGAYILWDIAATARGDWSFNDKFLTGFKVINLPVEEILFFFSVPFACIFIYENVEYYLSRKRLNISSNFFLTLSFLFFAVALLFKDQYYTLSVLMAVSLFFVIAVLFFKDVLNSRIFWIYILISYIPFLIVNYFLTSLPIVTYNENAIWGIRITTIPLEDFFYSFSMLSFFLIVYIKAKQKWLKEKK